MRVLAALVAAAIVLAPSVAHAACSSGNFFNLYPAGPSYPWHATIASAGGWYESFQSYANGTIIAQPGATIVPWWLSTSGNLRSKWVNGGQYKRGWVDQPVTRVIMVSRWPAFGPSDPPIKVRDQDVTVRWNVSSWHTGAPSYQGITVFARYQTEDDFYSFTVRPNVATGQPSVVVQRQTHMFGYEVPGLPGTCPYQPIVSVPLRVAGGVPAPPLVAGVWHVLRARVATVSGVTRLNVWVDGIEQGVPAIGGGIVQAVDASAYQIPDGASGLRADYVTAFLDYVTIQ